MNFKKQRTLSAIEQELGLKGLRKVVWGGRLTAEKSGEIWLTSLEEVGKYICKSKKKNVLIRNITNTEFKKYLETM